MTTETLIQLIISILSISITAFLTYYLAKQRYTFEKLYDRKLLYIEEIYFKIISLEEELKEYIETVGAEITKESLNKKKEKFTIVENKFFDLKKFFQEKEIIFEESSANLIKSFLDSSNKIRSKLKVSLLSQSNHDFKTSFNYFDKAFQTMENDIENIKKQLKKDFKSKIK